VTSVLKNQAATLQVALGNLLRYSKDDEILRFKKYAAVAAAVDPNQQGI